MWKWEAMNFRPSNTRSELSPLTMKSIVGFKAHLQADLARKTAEQLRAHNNAGKVGAPKRGMPAFAARNATATANAGLGKAAVRVKVEQNGSLVMAGSSSVVFRGPKMDAESKKKRACENPLKLAPAPVSWLTWPSRPIHV